MKKAVFAFIFFLLLSLPALADRPKVLVLHSYHEGMDWTDNVNRGIQDFYKDKFAEVFYEYMDTKRNAGSEYLGKLADLYRSKFRSVNFSAIIICDNNALSFFRKNRIEYYKDVPAVFCGINNYSPSLIEGISNITGVSENTDFDSTVKLMLKLHRGVKKIYIINDDKTTTGLANRKLLKPVVSKYSDRVLFEYIEDLPLEKINQKVVSLRQDSLIFLVTYSKDSTGRYISFREMIEDLSSVSPVPVYSTWQFYMGHGLTGGVITSGFEHGHTAAALAWKLVHGASASDIPVVEKNPVKYIFDYRMLTRFDIDLSDLPEGAEIINRPPSLWTQYKMVLLVAVIVLFLFVVILIIRIMFDAHTRSVLKSQNLLLDGRVKERTEKLEKAKRDRDRLLSIIGHDLRSPMANIISLCRIFNESFGLMDDDKKKELIAILQSRVEPTMELLDNLLNWTQNQVSGLVPHYEYIHIAGIVEKVRLFMASRISDKEIEFYSYVDESLHCYADRDMIETVIRNLVSNSIKFTRKNGIITVSSIVEGSMVRLSVADTGTGFSNDTLKDFENEELAKSSYGTMQEKGTGIGLSLCREMLHYHQSSMTFKSSPESGSEVSFYLPVKKPDLR